MQFPKASRFAGKHDVVLVGYRGVDGSSKLDCPEVESALKHSSDFLGQKSFRSYGSAFRPCAQPPPAGRRRSRRLLAAPAGRRPRRGPARARLSADRPPQRERRDAHGDDLRLALSEEHRSIRDDRRQSARQLPLVPEDDRRADPEATPRSARRTQSAAGGRTIWPRRSRRVAPHPRPLAVPADQAGQRQGRHVLRPDERDGDGGGAALGAADARHVARRRRGRRERRLVHVADGRCWSSRAFRSGAMSPPSDAGRRRSAALLRGGRPTAARSSAARAPTSSGPAGALADAWPASPDDNDYSHVRTRACRRC